MGMSGIESTADMCAKLDETIISIADSILGMDNRDKVVLAPALASALAELVSARAKVVTVKM